MPPEEALKTEEAEEVVSSVPAEASTEATVNALDTEDHESETPEDSWGALEEAFDEEFIGDEDEVKEPEISEDVPPVEAEKPLEEVKAKSEPEVEVKKEEEVPQEPAPKAEAEEKREEVKEEIPEPEPQLSAEQRQALRSQAVEQLTDAYKLSQEEAERFEVSPAEVLPKLAAEMHMRMREDILGLVAQQLPNAMESFLKERTVRERRESAFFETWPALKGYDTQVTQIAQMWRQMNPKASEREAIKSIGQIALGALGLNQTQTTTEPAPEPTRTVAETLPRTPPSSSASRGSGRNNVFEALNEAWDSEDFDS